MDVIPQAKPGPASVAAVRRETPQVRQERTGWRDLSLSQRHRMWGVGCPAVDVDLLLVEMNRGQAVALVEYKHELATPQYPTHPTYLAMSSLGDKADVPVFAVRYSHDFATWRVTSLNQTAKRMFPGRRTMSERQWVTFLYNLRGTQPPEQIFELLEREI